MRRKLLSIVVLSILVASTVMSCAQGQSTPSPAIFSTSGGNVSVMKAGTGSWVEAEVGMSLGPGDYIKCGGNSSAEITFLDGSTIELQAGTELEVVSLNISTETGSSTIGLKQTIGSIIFRVTKIVDPASQYDVETPAGVVAVRGSAVQITVTDNGTTWACNLEGDIWAVAQGTELQIPQGQCCVIIPGQPPALAQASSAYISLNPSSGAPGDQVELQGYGFVANEGIDILFDGQAVATDIRATSDGRLQVSFVVPPATPGSHTVTAEGEYTEVHYMFEIKP